MPPERAVHFLIQACRSLAEAHELGLVHRDIKPANLFVCRQGEEYDVLKVLDFGLVRPHAPGPSDVTLLTGQAIVGTAAYMAPESATEGKVEARTDLYSLGCVGYWLLSGRAVFAGKTPIEVILKHVNDEPTPLRSLAQLGVPGALDAMILSCLAKDPAQRPSSAEALDQMLTGLTFEQPWTRVRARESWRERR